MDISLDLGQTMQKLKTAQVFRNVIRSFNTTFIKSKVLSNGHIDK